MSTVHVVPLHDVVSHTVPGGLDGHEQDAGRWLAITADPSASAVMCLCRPREECVPSPDGPDGWLVTHHSLDGREQRERSAS